MDRNIGIIVLIFVGLCILQFGKIQGQWIQFTAPKLTSDTIKKSPLSFDQQQKMVIRYEHAMCEGFAGCAQATSTGDKYAIVNICRQFANEMKASPVPSELPPAVVKNIDIHRRALINSSETLADRWDSVGKKGVRLSHFASRWEIDTCSYSSVPQKVYRLYELDVLAGTKIVTCTELAKLNQRFQ